MSAATPETVDARVAAHEAVCAERYGNINSQLVSLHDRLNALSNRMWAAACGMLALSVTGLAAAVILLIVRKS